MNNVIRRIYLTIFSVLIISSLIIYSSYYQARELIDEEVKNRVQLSADTYDLRVDYWKDMNQNIIEDASFFIANEADNDEEIKRYLTKQAEHHPEFLSLYFVNLDGEIIISNDWVPDEDFVYSERPWYKEAIANGGFSLTQPFIDAYSKEYIVSLSSPVYNNKGVLIGVISGDLPIDLLESSFKEYSDGTGAQTVVLDKSGTVLMDFDSSNFDGNSEELIAYYQNMTDIDSKETVIEAKLFDHKGLFQYHYLPGIDWVTLSYASSEAYSLATEDLLYNLILMIALFSIIIFFIINGQKKYISKPLYELEMQIEHIDIEADASYRLDVNSGSPVELLQRKINDLLDHVFSFIVEINNDKEEFHALNEELEASFGQLVAVEQEVTRQKIQFESLFKNSPNAVVMFDSQHHIIEINDSFKALFKFDIKEIYGKNLDDIINIESNLEDAKSMTQALFNGDEVYFETVRYDKYKNPIEVEVMGVPMTYEGHLTGGFGIYIDISVRLERERYLKYVGTHDNLTELFDRVYFEKYLNKLEEDKVRPVGIIIIDINGLKLINDAFGMNTGDLLLKETAKIVRNIDYKYDNNSQATVSRIGGDEFSVVITNANSQTMEEVTRCIIDESKQVRINELELSLSLGWAISEDIKLDLHSVYKIAEDSMYQHKLTENPSIRSRTIDTIMSTLHEKSPREEAHSQRVSLLCFEMGQELSLPVRDVNQLKTMGLLHDLGKIAIDDKILNKKGQLTTVEYEDIKKHPEIGYRILSSVNELSDMATNVLFHHERWDGKGYPRGLKGEEIPYLSRIISIADAYDAMTSNRSYREALSEEEAISEILKNSGSQFDPELAPIFVNYLQNKVVDL